ncbi:MAG TPA: alpha/beta hydrolase [Ktedonobacteraceae bacterium]|jgi:pimeloyl-ACP methyl ester carboxylesterase
MSIWFEGELQANGIQIHYDRTGGEKPSLVLLHGVTDNGLCWTPVAQELEADYDVIMLDARGHGRSGRAEDSFSQELLAADVVACIQALHLGQTRLLGHSMGAATAALIAARHPELVQALLLEDPPWRSEAPQMDTPVLAPEDNPRLAWLRTLRAKSYEERIIQGRHDNPAWPEAELPPWAASKEQVDMAIFKQARLELPDWRELVGQISSPTLLLIGDTGRGAIVSRETAQQATQVLHDGQFIQIHGAGHNIRREQHAAYMAAITTFLRTQ